jgi:hypothetical protein
MRRRPSSEADAERWFADWRQTIPFTTEQLASAMEQELAEFPGTGTHPGYLRARIEVIRAGGRFSVREYTRYMLPRLIKLCAICGGRALYRQGSEGRCRAHKDQLTRGVFERNKRFDERSGAIEEARREQDTRDLRLTSFKATLLGSRRHQRK